MLILGLTGSIATGKSTVSRILSQAPYNLHIIDADDLARRVVAPGTRGYKQIVARFSSISPDLLTPPLISPDDNGSNSTKNASDNHSAPLNRAALSRCVFGDSEECQKNRLALNKIVHPAVRREIVKEVLKAYMRGDWLVVLDVPLLFEARLDLFCATVLVVAIRDVQVQMKRLKQRDSHLSHADAEARLQSQMDLSTKVQKCLSRGPNEYGQVIYNDADLEDLKQEVQQVILRLKKTHPKWWTWLLWLSPPIACFMAVWHFGRNWMVNRRWDQRDLAAKSNM